MIGLGSRDNKDEVKERDETLKKFVSRHRSSGVGFGASISSVQSIFSREAHERFAAVHQGDPPKN